MRKFFIGLLLAFAFLFPANITAYAADEEIEYSEIVDTFATMDNPQWTIHFNPEFYYKYEFWVFGFGRSDEFKKWNIVEMYYSFDLLNEYADRMQFEQNIDAFDVIFDFEYLSYDKYGYLQNSSASFTYPVSDYYADGSFSCALAYEDILSGSEYYVAEYPTVISSVKITLHQTVLNRCGTSIIYNFTYENDDFGKQICNGISCYKSNSLDMFLFFGDGVDVYREDETFDYFMYTIVPGSGVKTYLDLLHLLSALLIDLPTAAWNVIKFFFAFIAMLPGLIHTVVPFLPEYIIAGIMFVIVFSIIWGIISWIRSIIGD